MTVLLHFPLKTLREHGRDHKLKEAETTNQKREAQKSSTGKFERRQRLEKISQFRRIADLQNNLRKEMYELATIAH